MICGRRVLGLWVGGLCAVCALLLWFSASLLLEPICALCAWFVGVLSVRGLCAVCACAVCARRVCARFVRVVCLFSASLLLVITRA